MTWICGFKYKYLEGSLTVWPFSKIKIADSSKEYMASQVKGFWLRLHVRQEILIQFFILIYTFVVIILFFLFSLSKYAIMAIGSLYFCDYFIIFSVLFLLSITHTLSFSLMFLLSFFSHSFLIPLPNHF